MKSSKHKNPVLAPVNRRRKSALQRLKFQIQLNIKADKEGLDIPLSEVDKKRIEKEISVLESRIRL